MDRQRLSEFLREFCELHNISDAEVEAFQVKPPPPPEPERGPFYGLTMEQAEEKRQEILAEVRKSDEYRQRRSRKKASKPKNGQQKKRRQSSHERESDEVSQRMVLDALEDWD